MIKKNIIISFHLFMNDVNVSFKNSSLGTFWQSIFLSVQIFAMGPLFSEIFSIRTSGYTIFLTLNLILWNFMSGFINQATNAFKNVKHLFSNKDIGIFIPILKVYFLNLLIFSQNIFIFCILSFFLSNKFELLSFFNLYFFGIFLTITFIPLGIIVALLGIRFKDFTNIISNLTLFCFFVTPIFWDSDKVSSKILNLLNFNPFYHYITLFRSFFYKSEVFINLSSLIFVTFLFLVTTLIFIFLKNKIIKNKYLFWLFI